MCSWHWFLLVCFPPDCFLMRLPLAANFSCLHRLQSFFRACLRPCDWLHLSCAFHRLHYSRACDWLYMFSAHATGYIFSRACLRACDWLRVSRACHSLHFFPRLRLIVHGFRACHRLHFFRPCLRSCDWLYKFPALAMVGYIFHAYRFLRFKHFVLSHRVFCANRSF